MIVEKDYKLFRFENVIVLFHVSFSNTDMDEKEIAFVHYFDVNPHIYNIDEVFIWVCLKWATDDCGGHKTKYNASIAEELKLESGMNSSRFLI